ncbi:MAG: radical SAM protein [Eubacterium sp.]|nr:radical SAM protein [Eubacterium sp.]
MKKDVLVIGSITYNVNERIFTADKVSKQCVMRQCVNDGEKDYFYFEYLNKLLTDLNSHIRFNYMDIPTATGKELYEYLIHNNISTGYISNLDNQIEEVKSAIKNGVKCVVFKLGNFFNALPLIRGVKAIRRLNKDVKIIVSSLYVYNKYATDSIDNYHEMEKVIGADYYVKDISDYDTIYQYVRKFVDKTDQLMGVENDYDREEMIYCNTSVGCMAKCSFCNFPIRNKEYKCIEKDNLKEKLDMIEKSGKRYVCFYDDTFNLPINHFIDVCKMMIDNKYTFEWFAYCRLKELTEDMIILMKKARCKGVFVGIESANDGLLSNMNKGATRKDFSEKIKLLKDNNLLIFAFLLVGFPGETKETVYETIEYLQDSPIDFFTANLWYADISTPIYERAAEFGLKGKDFLWEHNNMNSEVASQYTNLIMNSVTNSTWVPNENFGFQAVVYLLSLGFELLDIKAILKNMKKMIKVNSDIDSDVRDSNVLELKNILRKYIDAGE